MTKSRNRKEKLYFVDGYHGGVEGHMPDGSFEDILDALERYPEWKVSFEIEPESWNELKRKDYPAYRRLKEFVESEESASRVEFISGAYGQPFCWAINGESNVRQLCRGIAEIKKHFHVEIDTYAVQEPCFTSALPQICLKLGYRRMSLKNPTAWGGYMGKLKGNIVRLYSADGSSLPAVPRYECEETVSCSATEGAGYDFASIDGFASKCAEHGIKHPLGMCLQDLGWSAHPMAYDSVSEYVTYREYFERFGGETDGEAKFSQDLVCCALPWGNRTLQTMCRKVRALENRVLQTEKLLSYVEMKKEILPREEELLKEVWDMLLLVQHHDGYICATTGGSPYKGWAARADYLTLNGQKLLDRIENSLMDSMQTEQAGREEVQYIRVYNTLGERRQEIIRADLTLPKGSQSVEVTGPDGRLCPVQMSVKRRYADESPDAVCIYFPASAEGIGYSTYCVKPLPTPQEHGKPMARITVQDTIEVENSELFVILDRTRGGAIVKLYDKKSGRDYGNAKESMGYLKGYFVEEESFVSTENLMAKAEIEENGPLYSRLRFTTERKGVRFETVYEFTEGSPRIDVTSSVNFPENTFVGYPHKPEEGEEYLGRERSGYREDYKLGVRIPLPMKEFEVIKHAPYENYVSENKDTRFLGWHEIKNNIMNQFLDFWNQEEGYGLAVLCDHVTGYSLVENCFSLTQAFGYHAGFWWGCQPLCGTSVIAYSILPHSGSFEDGTVISWNSRKNEPLLIQLLNGRPEGMEDSVFCVSGPMLETVTVYRENDRFYVRLFHHGMEAHPLQFEASIPGFQGEKADLNGRKLCGADERSAAAAEIITLY